MRIATKRQKIAFPKTVVKITIVEAEELSNLQLLDLLDPFVRLEHARGDYQTQVSGVHTYVHLSFASPFFTGIELPLL